MDFQLALAETGLAKALRRIMVFVFPGLKARGYKTRTEQQTFKLVRSTPKVN